MKKKNSTNFRILSSASALPLALLVANFANFAFNAVLGRVLSFQDFGVITLLNSFWYLLSIPINALGGTTTRKVAYLNGKDGIKASNDFFVYISKFIFKPTIILCILWILLTPALMSFFHMNSYLPIILFSPAIYFGTYSFVNRSFLQGRLFFVAVSITILVENFSRLIFALMFVITGYSQFTYLSIPLSIFCAFLAAAFYIRRYVTISNAGKNFTFPKQYFSSSIISGIATTTFLTVDIIMVQHYFNATITGEYALLSLIGKMIYFFGTLLTGIIFTYVSNHEGARKNPLPLFYKLFFISTLATITLYVFLGPLGSFFVPFLLGNKVNEISQYLSLYALALSLFTISGILGGYHLTREKYRFLSAGAVSSIAMILGIAFFHNDLLQIVYVMLITSLLHLLITITLHITTNYNE